MPEPDATTDHADSWELINTELAARLGRQDQSLQRIETKATAVAGFAAAAATFLAGRHPFRSFSTGMPATFAFVLYAVSFAGALYAVKVSRFADLDGPGIYGYGGREKSEVVRRLAAARQDLFVVNARKIRNKARVWWASMVGLSAGLVISILAVVHTG